MNSNKIKLAIVRARFNSEITEKLSEGARDYCTKNGIYFEEWSVPGAFEIPLLCQKLASIKKWDGVIALGAVIRGDTSHYDYVCNAVERGISEVSLKHNIPIGFGILTTENEEQALDRVGGSHGHKGYEAAAVTHEMVVTLSKVNH